MDNMEIQNGLPYFCTIGSGMEKFCVKELNKIENMTILEVIVGKIFFTTSCDPKELMSLKSVERLFVTVFHCKQFLCNSKTKVAFLNLRNLIEKEINWQSCLNQWIAFKKMSDIECNYSYATVPNLSKTFNFDTQVTEPAPKKKCLDWGSEHLSFRISCKSTGVLRKHFSCQKLSQFIGYLLVNVCGWKIDLKNPQLEVYVHASKDYFTIGFPVVSKPLSQRNYLIHIALRSTICYAMLLCFGEIPKGYILLDPMCGAGTLITEAAVNCPNTVILGVDIDISQLEKAHENVLGANCISNVQLFHADIINLPFRDESVNGIICDLPFGNKFGTPEEVKKLLPLAIREMNRILTTKGKVVLLINEALKKCLLDAISNLRNIQPSIAIDNKEGDPHSKSHLGHHNLHNIESVSTDGTLIVYPIEDSQSIAPNKQGNNFIIQWRNEENHTVKLGEMIASICIFEKEYCAENHVNPVSPSQ